MSEKRRVHLQLPAALEHAAREVGREHGFGLGPAIRVLLHRGLERGVVSEPCRDCAAGLAALIAAEQTLLVVASILPGGRVLIDSLASEAAAAAEQRLNLIGQNGHDAGGPA